MNALSLICAIIYGLLMLVFFILFLVTWLRRRQQLGLYFFYGLLAGSVVIGLQLAGLVTDQVASAVTVPSSNLIVIPLLLLDFVKMIIFTTVGISYARELGYPSVPLISGWQAAKHTNVERDVETNQLFIHTVILAGVFILYSIILFKLTQPGVGEALKQLFGNETLSTSEILSLSNFLLLLVFAVGEEIIFRLGIQNFLAKHFNWQGQHYWLAIVVTTVIWTLGHTGSLNPDWVKFAQIFPIGLCLGWLFRKYGLESCILAHGIFNIGLLPLSMNLISF